jgi:molybdopterin-guanine dinucleotide biosynthesis protein A
VCAATSTHEHHPLCAVVNCTIQSQLQVAITKKQYKIRTAWQAIGATSVVFTHKEKFRNVNTPTDIVTTQNIK